LAEQVPQLRGPTFPQCFAGRQQKGVAKQREVIQEKAPAQHLY